MPSVFEVAEFPPEEAVEVIRHGLPSRAFAQVASALALPQHVLARKLGLAPRTLNRKKLAKATLSPAESEKLLRAARVRNLARELFTTDQAISDWLKKPAPALGGAAPVDLLDTDLGAVRVEGLIRGLAYGNYQ